MMRDTIAGIDLGVGRPAEIEVSTLVDSAPLDVLDVEMMPMPAEAARRLAEALTAAVDRLQKQHSSRKDATWTYSRHGEDTRRGAERPHLGQWRTRGW